MSLNLPSPAPFNRRQDGVRIVVVLLLLVMIAVGAIPHYLKGQWSASQPPKVAGLKTLQGFVKGELNLPGWEVTAPEEVKIGELQWFQRIVRPSAGQNAQAAETQAAETQTEETQAEETQTVSEAIVLLRGQKGPKDRPQVEWTDLRGDQRWKEDKISTLQVGTTTARWFRAWWETESGTILTMAVAQWYAWPPHRNLASPGLATGRAMCGFGKIGKINGKGAKCPG